jgi:hypothetical protein
VGNSVVTRAARTADGKCSVCLIRKATEGHVTCPTCRKALAAYSDTRYRDRRKARLCYQCGEDSGGAYLCETHAAKRRKRRMRESKKR